MPMGFSHDPGPLPFVTVRDADKWAPRLANGMIEIIGEHGVELPLQMVRVAEVLEINEAAARLVGWHVPAVYAGRRLIAVRLEALHA
jgi:hypothetical protein